jgi:general secretion pathway protein B
MSILLSAKRQHERPGHAFEASLGLGVERERQWLGPVLAWLLGLPLCLLLGAGANYGWHWWHNKPIEERVELKESTPLPYRVAASQYEFTTIPFPAAPEMTETVMPAPAPANRSVNSLKNMNMDGVSPALAQRFMQAVQAEPGEPGASEIQPTAEVAPPSATPLADLPTSISSRVPPLRYSSHVYSSTASNRIVTLNGRDYHEGDEVAPGVKLLQIQADYSIFRVGSQSFSLPSLIDWNGVQ